MLLPHLRGLARTAFRLPSSLLPPSTRAFSLRNPFSRPAPSTSTTSQPPTLLTPKPSTPTPRDPPHTTYLYPSRLLIYYTGKRIIYLGTLKLYSVLLFTHPNLPLWALNPPTLPSHNLGLPNHLIVANSTFASFGNFSTYVLKFPSLALAQFGSWRYACVTYGGEKYWTRPGGWRRTRV